MHSCKFADDEKLVGAVNMLKDRIVIQTNLDMVEKWAKRHLMKFRKAKENICKWRKVSCNDTRWRLTCWKML